MKLMQLLLGAHVFCCLCDGILTFGIIRNNGNIFKGNVLHWIQHKNFKATDELRNAKDHLEETVKRLIEDGENEIDSSVDKALQDISIFRNDVPERCDRKTTFSLNQLRRIKLDYFLSCSNKSAVEKIQHLSAQSINVGARFFTVTQEGAVNIMECARQSGLEAYQCSTTAIWEIVKNIIGGYSEMKHFIVTFTAYGAHVQRNIHNCLHPDGIDIQDHVNKIMADYHSCVHHNNRRIL